MTAPYHGGVIASVMDTAGCRRLNHDFDRGNLRRHGRDTPSGMPPAPSGAFTNAYRRHKEPRTGDRRTDYWNITAHAVRPTRTPSCAERTQAEKSPPLVTRFGPWRSRRAAETPSSGDLEAVQKVASAITSV